MGIKAVLFDLDGTLLPMDQDVFIKTYCKFLAENLVPLGYDAEKLLNGVWKGTTAMVKNDGSSTNEDVFWKVFAEVHGEESLKDKPIIEAFYESDFDKVQVSCGFNPAAKEVIDLVKALGKTPVLATNPLFPAVATKKRIKWAGLVPEDFVLYTTYENSRHCKPNPQYYLDVLEQTGFAPEECLMVGNDVGEDMIAETLGMKVFLLTDCMINKEEKDINVYAHGGFEELKAYLRKL